MKSGHAAATQKLELLQSDGAVEQVCPRRCLLPCRHTRHKNQGSKHWRRDRRLRQERLEIVLKAASETEKSG